MARGRTRFARLAAVFALIVTACGCGGSGVVKGLVTYRGEPLPGGTVTFLVGEEQLAVSAPIREDGTYIAKGVPTGPAQVTVITRPPPNPRLSPLADLPLDSGQGSADTTDFGPARYVQIPPRYGSPATSGLALKVRSGTQRFDISLE